MSLVFPYNFSDTYENKISTSVTGTSFALTDAADGHVQNLNIKGRTDSTTAASVGDAGWGFLRFDSQDWNYAADANIFFTSTPDRSYNTPESPKQGGYNGYSTGYPVVTGIAYTEMPDKSIMLGPTSISSTFRIVVKDTSFNGNLDAFQAATKDITVFYPLGNPALGSPLVGITTNNGTGTGTSATLTTAAPYCSLSESLTDEVDMLAGVVHKKCGYAVINGSETGWTVNSGSPTTSSGSKEMQIAWPEPIQIKSGGTAIVISTDVVLGGAWNTDNTISTQPGDIIVLRVSGISTTSALQTYLASNPIIIVTELANPYTIPLTSAEISALQSLETYSGTTNITATDSPTMTVDYLRNTENGQAAANMQVNIIHALEAISPEQHRMIFRGKNLGSAVTAEQLAAIRDGSFRDLFVGDYWTIPVTISGSALNVNWRVADINYWLHCGDTAFETNHLVIVPDSCLYNAKMNSDNTTDGGYVGSEMYTANLAAAKTAINAAFPNIVLSHREYLVNAVSNGKASGGSWYDSTVELMNESMVYGHREFTPGCDGTTVPVNYTIDKTQLALFALAPKFIINRANMWLRDVVSAAHFAYVSGNGAPYYRGASDSLEVRTVFAIG